jgi:hypothetical protein
MAYESLDNETLTGLNALAKSIHQNARDKGFFA